MDQQKHERRDVLMTPATGDPEESSESMKLSASTIDQSTDIHEDINTDTDTERCLLAALKDIIANYPPPSHLPSQDSSEDYHGLWSGPTGIAYLLLHVSARRPGSKVAGRLAIEWARKYCGLDDDVEGGEEDENEHHRFKKSQGCGTGNEKLAYEAVRCAVASRGAPPSRSHFQEHKQHEDDTNSLGGQANNSYLHHVHRFAASLSHISSSS